MAQVAQVAQLAQCARICHYKKPEKTYVMLAYQSDLSLTGLDMILGRLSLRSVVALGEGFTRRKGLYPMGIAAVLCGVA